jgi:type IV pilus assembly protein PilY1
VTTNKSECLFNSTLNAFSIQTYVTAVDSSTVVATPTIGWYFTLQTSPSAERVISKPLAYGGIVDFLTFVPNSDVCSAGGTSYLCAVEYNTGMAPAIIALYHPALTNYFTNIGNSVTVNRCVPLGYGAPPKGDAIIIPPPPPPEPPEPPPVGPPGPGGGGGTKNKKNKPMKLIQTSTGAIPTQTNNPPIDVGSKIIQWLKK